MSVTYSQSAGWYVVPVVVFLTEREELPRRVPHHELRQRKVAFYGSDARYVT